MAQNLALDPAEPPQPGRPRAALRIASEDAPVDVQAAERAAADFLAALGVSLDREGLRETPARMARAYAELLAPRPFHLTTFPNDEGYDELVLARAIPFRTVCEHHLLPFSGVAHIGYLPADRIVGLSKLARLTEHFAARPQTQEGRGRAGGRALVHDPPRRAGPRRQDRHLGPARRAPRRSPFPGRVLRPGRGTRLTARPAWPGSGRIRLDHPD